MGLIFHSRESPRPLGSYEEEKQQRGDSHLLPRSVASVNSNNDGQSEGHSLMTPKYQNKIIQKLEKILEERKQSGDSSEHSPYRVKLVAHDNSCVMFTLGAQTPRKTAVEPRPNLSHRNSPLLNSPMAVDERENESLADKDSFRNRSLNSIKITDQKKFVKGKEGYFDLFRRTKGS